MHKPKYNERENLMKRMNRKLLCMLLVTLMLVTAIGGAFSCYTKGRQKYTGISVKIQMER